MLNGGIRNHTYSMKVSTKPKNLAAIEQSWKKKLPCRVQFSDPTLTNNLENSHLPTDQLRHVILSSLYPFLATNVLLHNPQNTVRFYTSYNSSMIGVASPCLSSGILKMSL